MSKLLSGVFRRQDNADEVTSIEVKNPKVDQMKKVIDVTLVLSNNPISRDHAPVQGDGCARYA